VAQGSGLNVAPVLNICFFSPLLHCFATFWQFRGLEQCRNVCGTDFDLEKVEILAKMMQNGKKKQTFGTGLNLALELHLVQS